MNEDTFEQFEINAEMVGDLAGYMKESDKIVLQSFDGNPINIELPKMYTLRLLTLKT